MTTHLSIFRGRKPLEFIWSTCARSIAQASCPQAARTTHCTQCDQAMCSEIIFSAQAAVYTEARTQMGIQISPRKSECRQNQWSTSFSYVMHSRDIAAMRCVRMSSQQDCCGLCQELTWMRLCICLRSQAPCSRKRNLRRYAREIWGERIQSPDACGAAIIMILPYNFVCPGGPTAPLCHGHWHDNGRIVGKWHAIKLQADPTAFRCSDTGRSTSFELQLPVRGASYRHSLMTSPFCCHPCVSMTWRLTLR